MTDASKILCRMSATWEMEVDLRSYPSDYSLDDIRADVTDNAAELLESALEESGRVEFTVTGWNHT